MIRHCWCAAAAAAAGARNYVCVSIIDMRVIELFSTSNQCVCVLLAKRVARTRINQSNRKLKLRHYSEQRTRDINVFECDTNSHSTIVFVRFNPKSINSIGSRNAIPSISPFSSFEHRFLSVRSLSANFFSMTNSILLIFPTSLFVVTASTFLDISLAIHSIRITTWYTVRFHLFRFAFCEKLCSVFGPFTCDPSNQFGFFAERETWKCVSHK